MGELTRRTGIDGFFNSGVVPTVVLNVGRLQLNVTQYDLSTILGTPTKRGYMATLVMPPGTYDVAPHFHPAGEITRVRKGSYFDADMDGNPIIGHDGEPLIYTEGMVVVSSPWSSHMPWSKEGADLEYFTPGGLVSLNREAMIPAGMPMYEVAEKTIEAATKQGAPGIALQFAMGWMIRDEGQRDKLFQFIGSTPIRRAE